MVRRRRPQSDVLDRRQAQNERRSVSAHGPDSQVRPGLRRGAHRPLPNASSPDCRNRRGRHPARRVESPSQRSMMPRSRRRRWNPKMRCHSHTPCKAPREAAGPRSAHIPPALRAGWRATHSAGSASPRDQSYITLCYQMRAGRIWSEGRAPCGHPVAGCVGMDVGGAPLPFFHSSHGICQKPQPLFHSSSRSVPVMTTTSPRCTWS